MTKSEAFAPDWISPPGETIDALITERGLTLSEFAKRAKISNELVKNLLQGRVAITLGIARKLNRHLGASVEFWIARDHMYRARVDAKLVAEEKTWISALPIKEMTKYGWLTPHPRAEDEVSACLQFFGVPDVSSWHKMCSSKLREYAFRTSASFDQQDAAVVTWIRQGEREADEISCTDWSPSAFRESLDEIRKLTRIKDPKVFIPKLRDICSAAGVAQVAVRCPPGCRASGATRFVSSKKALLLLSFRYLSDDQFWFSFFHEAGHLLLHGTDRLFLEGDGVDLTSEESEANAFAKEILIPENFRDQLGAIPLNAQAIIRFSTRINIASGIVVGQLQHRGRLRPNQLNSLKRRYRWVD